MANSEIDQKKGFRDLLGEVIIPKIEAISLIVLSIGLILKYFEIGSPAALIAIGLTNLAITSYLLAFLQKPNGILQMITFKMGHIACSVALVGVMFTFLNLPGNLPMLQIGSLITGVAFVLAIFIFLSNPPKAIYRTLLRFGLVLAFSITTLFI